MSFNKTMKQILKEKVNECLDRKFDKLEAHETGKDKRDMAHTISDLSFEVNDDRDDFFLNRKKMKYYYLFIKR